MKKQRVVTRILNGTTEQRGGTGLYTPVREAVKLRCKVGDCYELYDTLPPTLSNSIIFNSKLDEHVTGYY